MYSGAMKGSHKRIVKHNKTNYYMVERTCELIVGKEVAKRVIAKQVGNQQSFA